MACAQLARFFIGIDADRQDLDTARMELIKTPLETP